MIFTVIMAETISFITNELNAIREDLSYIKKHMVDSDTILTCEENIRLNESIKNYKEGKAMPIEEFEKSMRK